MKINDHIIAQKYLIKSLKLKNDLKFESNLINSE